MVSGLAKFKKLIIFIGYPLINYLIDTIHSQFEHHCVWHGGGMDIGRIFSPGIRRIAIGKGSVTTVRNRVGCINFWCWWLCGYFGGWMGMWEIRTPAHIVGVRNTNGDWLVFNYVRQKRMVPLLIQISIWLCWSIIVCRNSIFGCRGIRRQVRILIKLNWRALAYGNVLMFTHPKRFFLQNSRSARFACYIGYKQWNSHRFLSWKLF